MPSIGRYCNGDKFVVSPVKITSITPTETVGSATPAGQATQTGIVKNGAMMNPSIGGHAGQGFTNVLGTDNGVAYDAAKKITLPLEFTTGQEGSVIKSIFKEDLPGTGHPSVKALAVLTVVKTAPPAGAFRPAVSSTDKTSYWTEPDDLIDVTTLPNRTIIPGGPGVSSVIGAIKNWQPSSWTHGDPARSVGAGYNNPFGAYPVRDIGPYVAAAIQMLTMAYTAGQKRDLAVCLCQMGIDVLGFLQNFTGGLDYGGVAGQGALGGVVQRGYKLALGVAGLLLDDAGMKAYANFATHQPFGEDGMYGYVSAGMVAADQSVIGGGPGRDNYTSGELGAPEWTSANRLHAAYVNVGDRKEDASYRAVCSRYCVSHAMASHMFPGLSAVLNNQCALDYPDRIMERTFFNGSGTNKWARSLIGTNAPTTWDKAVWDAYRTESGMPAIWNW